MPLESSPRAGQPFATINCSALPETLFESELFGYERGAFTGAHAASPGRLQAAQGGHSLSRRGRRAEPRDAAEAASRHRPAAAWRPSVQHHRRPLGGCHKPGLSRSVRDGLFRADLFYRLNVYSVAIPPLRQRPGDILALAQAFLDEIAAYGRSRMSFSDGAPSEVDGVRLAWERARAPQRGREQRAACR